MKDIDLKTILIGIFVLAYIIFGISRWDVGRYATIDGRPSITLDTKTGTLIGMDWPKGKAH